MVRAPNDFVDEDDDDVPPEAAVISWSGVLLLGLAVWGSLVFWIFR